MMVVENVLWLDLQRYPTTLLVYALGLGAWQKVSSNFLDTYFKL